MSVEHRILESLTRVLARIDALQRSLEELQRYIHALATTVYAQCLMEKLGPGRIIRVGLPPQVDAIFIPEGSNKVYVAKLKPLATSDDAEKIRSIAPHVATLVLGSDAALDVVPTIIAGKYEGNYVPPGVELIVC
jgi:hypothetical protein